MDKSIYIAKNGNDRWSGLYSEPLADKTDGPLATIQAARDKIRKMRGEDKISGKITVFIRSGRYSIQNPIEFTPEDSKVTYTNFPGEKVVIDCGIKITGWKKTAVNDVSACVVQIPEVKNGKLYFRQLFVNGKRKSRTVIPEGKDKFFRVRDVFDKEKKKDLFSGSNSFFFNRGDIKNWKNLEDVEIVMFHKWIEERMPVSQVDEKSDSVFSSKKTVMAVEKDTRYRVENVFEELKKPGQWYLDRKSGLLYYILEKEETIDSIDVYAPLALQAIKIEGDPENNCFVEDLKIKGITIEHADWFHPYEEKASCSQSAYKVPGVVFLKGCKSCAIANCEIRHCGCYGIEISDGCSKIEITGNRIWDMGAGGIKINGGDAQSPALLRTYSIVISNNHIYNCGNVFYSAVGILSMHSANNLISDNHIHNLYYSGISCGWVWGYSENVSKNNIIENNLIHDIGKGLLSDMGGIYTLGVQPGTVIKGNTIYNLEKSEYGAWCIYLDEGSSHIIVEKNLCAFTNSQVFHQHYGRENIIRNNIFAFGKEGIIAFSRKENHNSFTFERNILLTDRRPFFVFGYGCQGAEGITSNLNIFWDISAKQVEWGIVKGKQERKISFEDARKKGFDTHSSFVDPGFVDPLNFDFRLKNEDSITLIGFKILKTKITR
ncbi:MAG: right-handed parallel beta-helix repeat-containing protein [Candidatus Omnitrophica bacterium]|nr:right-handed parallel beta-helix repeat-containing protein [Candidatus Omnitrophota bacterium]